MRAALDQLYLAFSRCSSGVSPTPLVDTLGQFVHATHDIVVPNKERIDDAGGGNEGLDSRGIKGLDIVSLNHGRAQHRTRMHECPPHDRHADCARYQHSAVYKGEVQTETQQIVEKCEGCIYTAATCCPVYTIPAIQLDYSFIKSDILGRFLDIRPHRYSEGPFAPHKPLLLIWTIGRCLQDEVEDKPYTSRLLPYRFIKEDFEPVIREFGIKKTGVKVNMPYWYLKNDNVWDLRSDLWAGPSEPNADFLNQTSAGLTESDYLAIRNDPHLGIEIIIELLIKFIPNNRHEDILAAIKVPMEDLQVPDSRGLFRQYWRRMRDRKFRDLVLSKYQYQCTVCGLAIKLGRYHPALEAAHIKAVQNDGPDIISNGLSLCSTHHALFDEGAFTVAPKADELYMEMSSSVLVKGTDRWLSPYINRSLHVPKRPLHRPATEFIEWHRNHVFVV